MPYDIRFRETSRHELDQLVDTYGGEFHEAWREWTELIAERSERRNAIGSIELLEVIEHAAEIFESGEPSPPETLQRPRLDMLRAVRNELGAEELALLAEGKPAQIAQEELAISRATYYRRLASIRAKLVPGADT